MSHSSPDALQQRCQQIVTSPVLSPEQKRHFLALEAENNLPYPALPEAARAALDDGLDTLFGARAAACVVAGGGDTVVLVTGSGPRPRPSLRVERALASEASAFSDALLLQGGCSGAE